MRIAPAMMIVLVLYECSPEASAAFVSLRRAVSEDLTLSASLSLLVYDNSPYVQSLPFLSCDVQYHSDRTNQGLARAYNVALEAAQRAKLTWLLLLDQDTAFQVSYLQEAIELIGRYADSRLDVCAIVPKLANGTLILSPSYVPRLSHPRWDAGVDGISSRELLVFNSGAVMRIQPLLAIGGFPEAYRLDFLDHVVFHKLQESGQLIHVMRARLAHELSSRTLGGDASLGRYQRMLQAERRFYSDRAKWEDRMWYHLRKMKQAMGLFSKVRDKRFAWWSVKAALGVLPGGQHAGD